MGLTFTDIFCGAGGSSIGLTEAGLELRLAANHWDRAIETHAANFRDAEHLCADVNNYDMRRLPKTDVLWASPICTEASPAGKRRSRKTPPGQLDLLEDGPVSQAGYERTRATFHDVIRATEVHRYPVVLFENVPAVAEDWELFDWWVKGMTQLRPGYHVQFVSVSSAHIGSPVNPYAAQYRCRLYGAFTRADITPPNLEPRPLAWCADCGQDVAARQSWRKPGARRIGQYRRQYDYRCPNSACRHALVEPYVLPAASVIDWSNLGERIGERQRPLAAATVARIEAGLRMFGEPTMLAVNHHDPADPTGRAYPAGAAPLPTRTVKIGDGLACPPFIAELRGGGSTARSVSDPLATITAGGNHHGLTVPPGAVPSHTGELVIPYRKNKATTHAAPTIDVADCRFRMLQPREHLRAQRFPDSYVVHGNKGEQTMQAGNAVSANVAHWLGAHYAAALDGRRYDDLDHYPGQVAA